MTISLDFKATFFIQKEISENEKGVIRPELDRWEWACSERAVMGAPSWYREGKYSLYKQCDPCFGTLENESLKNQLKTKTKNVSSCFTRFHYSFMVPLLRSLKRARVSSNRCKFIQNSKVLWCLYQGIPTSSLI